MDTVSPATSSRKDNEIILQNTLENNVSLATTEVPFMM